MDELVEGCESPFSFCRLLQNHTRTSSGSMSRSWDSCSMIARFGLGSLWKVSSRILLADGVNTALFFLFRVPYVSPAGERVGDGRHSSLTRAPWGNRSACFIHATNTSLMEAALRGLSCICSNREIVLCAKLTKPILDSEMPTAPWV